VAGHLKSQTGHLSVRREPEKCGEKKNSGESEVIQIIIKTMMMLIANGNSRHITGSQLIGLSSF
jgi:hypothetical protein